MSDSFWGAKRTLNPAGASLDASGANSIDFGLDSVWWLSTIRLITTVAQTVADATITVALRDKDDGNSTTLGTFVLPYSGSATDDIKYVQMIKPLTSATTSSIDGSTTYSAEGKGPVKVLANQEIVLTSDGGGNAGTYIIYFEGVEEGLNKRVYGTELTLTAA